MLLPYQLVSENSFTVGPAYRCLIFVPWRSLLALALVPVTNSIPTAGFSQLEMHAAMAFFLP